MIDSPHVQRLMPILKKLSTIPSNHTRPIVIAIDGRSASGKSTMANDLSLLLNADIIKMDDFFLPLNMRNENRMKEAGGNVHYERFIEEVLPFLHSPQPFSYYKFNCSKMDYDGEITISSPQLRIVEGSYSLHPKFGKYTDVTIFSDISPEEQMKRIIKRNGEVKAKRFQNEWIPMEEIYFSEYKIRECADFIV